MMVETHMLKPYKKRVEGTYELMKSMIEIVETNGEEIKSLRKQQFETFSNAASYALDWEIDTTKSSTLLFKGFEGSMIASEITGSERLKYDLFKPFTKEVLYQDYFKPKIEVDIPKAYIIPQGWWNVIDLLKLNQIEMKSLEKDSVITVVSYKIESFDTRRQPYEGHYQHYNTKLTQETKSIQFSKGDYIVFTNQKGIRYLLETLEPQAPDSFFNWNLFDTILQQKEGFSPYVWEDMAKELLNKNEQLRTEFEAKKSTDSAFANNWYAQLDWIHMKSDYYEKTHMQYPVYKIN